MDWDRIRLEYGTVSLRKLAERHGVSHTAIRKRAVMEGWKLETEKVETSAGGNQEVETLPQPVDPGAKWHPVRRCFVSRVVDGKFTCLKCGFRAGDLSGHECDQPDLWVSSDDVWAETEARIRSEYRDPTPEELKEMPALKTVEERLENARRYHDWHIREFNYPPTLGGSLGVR